MAHCERSRQVVGNGLSHHELQRVSNVCGVSGIELLIIIVAAVVFLGPDKLPDLARTVGKLARDLRSATDEFTQAKDDFTRSIDPKKLIGEGDKVSQPRKRPGSTASRDAAAIAAIREEKEIGKAAANSAGASGEASEASISAMSDSSSTAGESDETDADVADIASEEVGSVVSESADVEAFTAPPLDPKYSPDGETEWLRKRLKDAAEKRTGGPLSGTSTEQSSPLPQIRPAVGSIAMGESTSVPEDDELDIDGSEVSESTESVAAESSVNPTKVAEDDGGDSSERSS